MLWAKALTVVTKSRQCGGRGYFWQLTGQGRWMLKLGVYQGVTHPSSSGLLAGHGMASGTGKVTVLWAGWLSGLKQCPGGWLGV